MATGKITPYTLRRAIKMVEHSCREARARGKDADGGWSIGSTHVGWIEDILIGARAALAALEAIKNENDRKDL